ncbi:MAG: AAA+ family ATPase [Chloroflexaceae bacterium]|nr:AAA+ family ATPase [Chloroflexaceae bacterium]
MKPNQWDTFLKQIASEYQLRGKPREIFLTRFAYENWRKPDREVWELAEAASYETYKKQMTDIYANFSKNRPDGCPELDTGSKGPGKFQVLREWLKDIKYAQWSQAIAPDPGLVGLSEVRSVVRWDSPCYIKRPPIEADCCQEILNPGALIRIKAPEKMGKTSLLRLLLAHGEACGCRTVYLNLLDVEKSRLSDLDKFLRWFCANASRQLGIEARIDDYWDEENFGSLVSCQDYFEGHLLAQADSPLILGIDNVDRVFEHLDIAEDFLAMLRSWHEEANNSEAWQKLRLIIANSTEVYIELNIHQSPFNVGLPVRLPGFTLEQVEMLAQAYGLNGSVAGQLEALRELVGGHPYLLRLALYQLARQEITWEQLLQTAPTQGGIYGDFLLHHWDNLQKQPELAAALKQAIATEGVQLEPRIAYKLESMGLVLLQGDEIVPSCELHKRFLAIACEDGGLMSFW